MSYSSDLSSPTIVLWHSRPMTSCDVTGEGRIEQRDIHALSMEAENSYSTTISSRPDRLRDGSKKGSIVSLGVYSKDLDLKINKRITDNNSTTAAELAAIDEAIKTIQEKKIESENIVILTDSLAATLSIKNPNKTNARQDLTESINIRANDLQEKNQTQVQICWIPAHCNIEGNEKADKQAKLGLGSKTRRKTGLGPSEVKSIINQYKNKMWQDMWTNNPKGRFFHAIAPQ
ncbi:hypothetical protein EGW08_015241, partial [Elysia chlorotica]